MENALWGSSVLMSVLSDDEHEYNERAITNTTNRRIIFHTCNANIFLFIKFRFLNLLCTHSLLIRKNKIIVAAEAPIKTVGSKYLLKNPSDGSSALRKLY